MKKNNIFEEYTLATMKKIFLLFLISLTVQTLFSQNPAELESTFNINNLTNINGGCPYGIRNAVSQADGKIYIRCMYEGSPYNGRMVRNFERLNANGSLDTTFNPLGVGFNGGSIGNPTSGITIVPLQDGKVLVAGSFTSYNGTPLKGILRLNDDGSLDTGFSTTVNFGNVTTVTVLSDGKILIGGSFTSYNGTTYNRLMKLNADGTPDTSFSIGTGFNDFVNSVYVQNDGKMYVVGNFTSFNGTTVNRIARLNTDGSLDTTFFIGTGFNGVVNTICHTEDDKLLIGGNFSAYKGTTKPKIVKLNLDGSIDATFVITTGFDYQVARIVALSGGNVAVFGEFFTYNGAYIYKNIELNSVGAINTTATLSTTYTLNNAFVQSDGKIIIIGDFSSVNNVVVNDITRLNSDETVDPTFSTGIGFNFTAERVKMQSDGKIVACGGFTLYNGVSANGLIRLNNDGTQDTSFAIGTGFMGEVRDIEIQPDGKIIAGGYFSSYNGTPANGLIRLNADGSIDSSFNIGTGFSGGAVNDIVLLPDGKIAVGGAYTSFNGNSFNNYFVRLNSNGSFDVNCTDYGNEVTALGLQSDGKIVAASISSASMSGQLYRIGATGGVDGTFQVAYLTSVYSVNKITIQNDGKVLYAGSFFSSPNIYRLNANGTADATFVTGTGFDGIVDAIAIQPNNTIIATGSFDKYNGTNASGVIRLNVDGTVDPSFYAGTGFGGNVIDILLQPDGKILMAGNMSNYNNYVIGGLVRLIGNGSYSLSGQNKLDLDLNGCTASDIAFPNLKFNFNDGTNTFDFFSDTTGSYSFLLNAGNYTITPIVNASYNVSPTSVTANFPSQFTSLIQNYCLTSADNLYNDLEVQIIPLFQANPGFPSIYKVVYKNKGFQSLSGNVGLTFDDQVMDYVSAVPAVASQLANSVAWNFTNLAPQEQRTILAIFDLNSPTDTPPLNSADVLTFNASISIFPTETTPNDNTFTLHQTVTNSLDPNDKTCLEGNTVGIEKIGDYVHYLIRFENNGTADAKFIKIIDMIDTSKFDISTLEPINSSHIMTTKISDGNKVEFFFNNINLPFDDANNDGYVMYKIKLKSNLVLGNSFSNTANIYFDFNLPIITNTTTTTIALLSNNDFVKNSIKVYPNPVRDILNISQTNNETIKSISVYNLLGQQLLYISMESNEASINVSQLKTGNYIVKLETQSGTLTQKFSKL